MTSSSRGGGSTHQPRPVQPVRRDWAQLGMTCGLSLIVGSAVVGSIAYTLGNNALYNRLFRARMITVVRAARAARGVERLWRAAAASAPQQHTLHTRKHARRRRSRASTPRRPAGGRRLSC
jgi:hypothetical protein